MGFKLQKALLLQCTEKYNNKDTVHPRSSRHRVPFSLCSSDLLQLFWFPRVRFLRRVLRRRRCTSAHDPYRMVLFQVISFSVGVCISFDCLLSLPLKWSIRIRDSKFGLALVIESSRQVKCFVPLLFESKSPGLNHSTTISYLK